MPDDTFERLAEHLSALGMGLPVTPDLVEILQANLTPAEAEVLLLLPAGVPPLHLATVEVIAASAGPGCNAARLDTCLEELARRRLVFAGRTASGERGYGLLQAGFGFPQTFFWTGEQSEHARSMAGLVTKYANRRVTAQMYGTTPTKPYRYVPLDRTLSAEQQAVFPTHAMEPLLAKAERFAVAHCPCRVAAGLLGKGCGHPLEVCLKFDELAEYLLERGLGREVDREEARAIVRLSAEAGLVHFVDNAAGNGKHNCNCCGDACWNVGSIRRRKVPRDVLMATYFLRSTDAEACTGCGICAEVCPVWAVKVEGPLPAVDEEWCIGCGVCVASCPEGAAGLTPRVDRSLDLPASFAELHGRILAEKSGDTSQAG